MPKSIYSDITSLSGLTTASTVSVYDILPTPADERSDPLLHGTAVSKRRGLSRVVNALGAAEILDSYQDASPYMYQTTPDIHIIQASSDDSFVRSPPPPTPPPKNSNLAIHRRRSTKELIGMYESTSSSPSLSHTTTTTSSKSQRQSIPLHNMTRSKNQTPEILETRPSNEGRWNPAAPMRYSFQNLLGVFGKKQKQPNKEFTVFRPPTKIPELSPIPNRQLPALTEGQLIYLSRSSSNVISWKRCTAALYPPYLRLSFTQPLPGTPLTYSINLSQCVEVHSIGANKLDPSIIPNIAGQSDAHVFEMELDGGIKERFAAGSVKDRGAWVSKIWDIILSRNATHHVSIDLPTRSASPVTIDQRADPPLRVINASHLSSLSGSTENRSSSLANASPKSDLSISGKPSLSQTDLTPSEAHSHIQLTPERSIARTIPSTPSIQNLDDRSIVKQRLARIKNQFGDNITSYSARKSSPPVSASSHGLAKEAYHDNWRGSKHGRAPSTTPLPAPRAVYPGQTFTPLPSFTWESLPLERYTTSASSLSSYSASPSHEEDLVTASLPHTLSMLPTKVVTLHDGDPSDESWRSFINITASPLLSAPSITLHSTESAVMQDSTAQYTQDQSMPSYDIGERVAAVHDDLRHLGKDITKVISMQNQDPRDVNAAASMPLVLDDLSRVHKKLDVLVQGETPLGTASLHRKLDEVKDDLGKMDLRVVSSLQDKLDDLKRIVASTPQHFLPNSQEQPLREPNSFASKAIMEKLDEVHRTQTLGNARPPANLDLSPVLLKLEELRSSHNRDTISTGFALILKKLDELQEETSARTTSNDVSRESQEAAAIQLAPVDLSDVHAKLDNVMELCRSLTANPPSPPLSPQPDMLGRQLSVFRRGSRVNRHNNIPPVSEESPEESPPGALGSLSKLESNLLQQIFDVLKEEKDHREAQRSQQLESVRYLHELNQWLEQFVHQHTSQAQNLSQGVTRLLDGLGLSGSTADGSEARPDIVSLLAEVHHTVLDLKQRESGHSALQNTVNMLIHKVNEDLERISAERRAMTSELMVSMFDQQRQEQQLFVRALATDLTNQIRGERMQFVDAMKEVTSVNLKAQVLETTKILAGLSQTIGEHRVS